METILIAPLTEQAVLDYIQNNNSTKDERLILSELLDATKTNDLKKIDWFLQFGDDIRHIVYNVHCYRQQINFGFMEISIAEYGWLAKPIFLEKEDVVFGNEAKHGENSTVHIGRGLNHIWTYSLSYSFGMSGSYCSLHVYTNKKYTNREEALKTGIDELKKKFLEVVGHTDTSNFKPSIISTTLKSIDEYQIKSTQLTLF